MLYYDIIALNTTEEKNYVPWMKKLSQRLDITHCISQHRHGVYQKNLAYLYVPVLAFYRGIFSDQKKNNENQILYKMSVFPKQTHLLLLAVK